MAAELNGFRKWLIGGIATSFLMSVSVSVGVTLYVSDHANHPVSKTELDSIKTDVREIRSDVKTLLRRTP